MSQSVYTKCIWHSASPAAWFAFNGSLIYTLLIVTAAWFLLSMFWLRAVANAFTSRNLMAGYYYMVLLFECKLDAKINIIYSVKLCPNWRHTMRSAKPNLKHRRMRLHTKISKSPNAITAKIAARCIIWCLWPTLRIAIGATCALLAWLITYETGWRIYSKMMYFIKKNVG